jgi:hypothetical protein
MSNAKLNPAELDFSGVVWEKSPFSLGNDNCVEFGVVAGHIAVRDSKRPEQAPLVFDRDEIAALLAGAKAGSFDHLV